MPVALPVGVALHRQGRSQAPRSRSPAHDRPRREAPGTTLRPRRRWRLCVPGRGGPPPTTVVSRMRRDAALFGPKPAPTGRRGRPRTRGERLPTPPEMAGSLRRRQFRAVTVEWRGRSETRFVWSREALWYGVCPKAMVRLVVARRPGRGRARRLLLHHRSRDGARRRPLALRRTLGDRSHLPRTSSRSSAVSSSRPGRARGPSAPPTSRSSCTARSGLVPHHIGPDRGSPLSPGTRPSAPRPSPTRWRNYAVLSGPRANFAKLWNPATQPRNGDRSDRCTRHGCIADVSPGTGSGRECESPTQEHCGITPNADTRARRACH